MQKTRLPNGLTVLFERKKGMSVVVEVMVKTGSNNEQAHERGISHFIEHMVFEGTLKRPTNWDISNEIEKIGGDLNAYTTNGRMCFYVKVLKKYFPKAVDVLADILQNPSLNPKEIEKEKNVVIKEIELVNDDPKFYQWVLLQKNLYEKHPTKYPVYGSKTVVKALTEEKVRSYFNQHFIPNNMSISIVGDVKDWRKQIAARFVMKPGKRAVQKHVHEPLALKNKEVKEKKNVVNTYIVMGFKTVPRNHPDSYVFDVINGILGRGQSGKLFTEIRGKKGLAYDVGTQHVTDIDFGYFSAYATIGPKNLLVVKKMILEELEKLKRVTKKEVNEAKTYIEGDYYLDLEDTQKVADQLLFWEQTKNAEALKEFIHNIKKVSEADIKRAAAKYFKNYTLAVVEGK